MVGNDIIYFLYGDPLTETDIVKWGNCEISEIQEIKDTKFGKYKVIYDNSPFGYFVIGCKYTGIVLDGIEYMADETGMLDIKQINTHLYNRKISKALEKL